ncbi:hypothetical protein SAMN02744133_10240 [Thalassospira xiamenensis M-5 = DSM 17429]|uniref:Lipoprotein n=1 Tax=Thalassospira xiamenensis M-5 = DSM 17429 TaxID=1123366 RepID=A0AB72U9I5_9PROT|nr:hypothetical protein [Thalassospira xiamenensis]AJD50754.1 hypothetical protein TH3_03140 [Thalassospira xiamenensis M-5 = DSM 17429]SIS72672.1 hypothetical protein SAMN02744133_10240 [Thalassospira xiamenensis M-5 = DSM 17429]
MNITHIKRAGLAGVISITAALSACGTPSATPDIDVQSDDMEEASATVVASGYSLLTGTALVNTINDQTFSYRDEGKETNVNVTYFQNGKASITWIDEDGDRGMREKLWTIEQGQYLCLWGRDEEDDCMSVLTKAGQLATIDNDGNVAYYTNRSS